MATAEEKQTLPHTKCSKCIPFFYLMKYTFLLLWNLGFIAGD